MDYKLKFKVRQSILDMQNMFDLTAIKSSVRDKSPDVPNLIINPTSASIVFDKVKFQYTDGRELFKDLSFEVPSGKKIAIVGGSGSGKSSIVRLLFRFYDSIEGLILINNQDLRDISLSSLRKTIGVILNDTVLFNDTILHNIHYGNLNAPLEVAYKAAKIRFT